MKLKNGMWCNANPKNLERLKSLNLKVAENILYAFKYKSNFYIKDGVIKWGHKKCIGFMFNKNYWNKSKKINFRKIKLNLIKED